MRGAWMRDYTINELGVSKMDTSRHDSIDCGFEGRAATRTHHNHKALHPPQSISGQREKEGLIEGRQALCIYTYNTRQRIGSKHIYPCTIKMYKKQQDSEQPVTNTHSHSTHARPQQKRSYNSPFPY